MNKVQILEKYLPEEAAPVIVRWIDFFQCEFKVSRSRNSKYGDYRPPFNGKPHRISVNNNLNQFAFLVTTVHEFAHLLTWNEYKKSSKPHGQEWKSNFKRMMAPFFEKSIFPPDINAAITKYLENPAASSCTDLNLYKTLKLYDTLKTGSVTVDILPVNTIFKLKNGRTFRKEEKIRKRFRCVEISTGALYLFNPMAEVFCVEAV
ncbi:MAG TPA: SprT-like domain-containing protein [Sphingobacteriaceae bacterium]|nr:SprT-like domain-containing protein [Sphingobacteriaceae bacterium]